MARRGLLAEIVFGQLGATARKNQAALPVHALIGAEGVVFADGILSKEPGAARLLQALAGGPAVTGLRDWRPDAATQRLITFANGTLWKDNGVQLDGTSLATGLTATARPWFVEAGQEDVGRARKLFVYTGADAIRVLTGDGATAPAIAAGAADWTGTHQPLAGVLHRQAIWSFGNLNDPHRWYRSRTTDHEDYTTTPLDDTVEPGLGYRLCAAVPFQGVLWFFKFPEGICYLDDQDPDPANWVTRIKSTALGIVESPWAVLPIDDDILFLAPDGSFHLLSAVNTLGGTEDSDLSAALGLTAWIQENLNLSRLTQVASVWDPQRKLARFGLPRAGSTSNDCTLYFDFSDWTAKRVVKFSWSFRDSCEAFALRRDPTTGIKLPIVGGTSGVVYQLNQSSRTKDGGGYLGSFQTAHADFRHLDRRLATRRKRFESLTLVMHPQGQWDLAVDVLLDGEYLETIPFSMGVGGAALDSFALDSAALGGGFVTTVRHRLRGSGVQLSLVGRNSGAGQNFSLAKALVAFTPAAEDRR